VNCYACGKRGRATGVWFSKPRRNKWVRFRCENPACAFEYTRAKMDDELDGQKAKVQPTWMVPMRVVK
jgi:hypothetical protein